MALPRRIGRYSHSAHSGHRDPASLGPGVNARGETIFTGSDQRFRESSNKTFSLTRSSGITLQKENAAYCPPTFTSQPSAVRASRTLSAISLCRLRLRNRHSFHPFDLSIIEPFSASLGGSSVAPAQNPNNDPSRGSSQTRRTCIELPAIS